MKIAKAIHKLSTENAFKVFQRSIELEKSGKEIIHLSLGQPDFLTPRNIVEAAKKALDDGYHGYTPSNGIYELRKEAVKFVDKYNRKSKFRRGIASLHNIGLIATFKKVMLHIYSRFMSYKNI